MSDAAGYSRTQILLHWGTVLLVALQYLLHGGVATAYDRAVETGDYAVTLPVALHAAGGMAILLLATARLLLRKEHGTPPPPEGEPPLFQKLGHGTHLAFYGLLFLLPVTGAAAWGGQMAGASTAHEVLKTVLLILIIAHVGAVALHQWVWKTGLIRRMTVPRPE
ncbi:Cytochrome B561 [Roseibacterium elongatum DSM 19469]|uniref:Cytochrome B561 n=1 Tax=Roseicyclus elongatus DSM 19469 TaxID=1294273 RepID=W8RSQ7_9RHOB|nr:cytochrome b/b6 domain-containing protein [Roseibacterium elongatum]AHM04168.1 Cytochrome B561 [Roseibacterium elongatum DSM 19469]